MDLTPKVVNSKKGAFCLNSEQMTVKGVTTYGSQTESLIFFLPCKEDPEVADKEASCYSNTQVKAWYEENEPYV